MPTLGAAALAGFLPDLLSPNKGAGQGGERRLRRRAQPAPGAVDLSKLEL